MSHLAGHRARSRSIDGFRVENDARLTRYGERRRVFTQPGPIGGVWRIEQSGPRVRQIMGRIACSQAHATDETASKAEDRPRGSSDQG